MNTTRTRKRLADKEQPYTYLCPLRQIGIGLFFRFGTSNQPEDVAERLHNRRACSALQGIGGWATNKQSAKSKTFAQLASLRAGHFSITPQIIHFETYTEGIRNSKVENYKNCSFCATPKKSFIFKTCTQEMHNGLRQLSRIKYSVYKLIPSA